MLLRKISEILARDTNGYPSHVEANDSRTRSEQNENAFGTRRSERVRSYIIVRSHLDGALFERVLVLFVRSECIFLAFTRSKRVFIPFARSKRVLQPFASTWE